MQHRRSAHFGMTLVELLVVVAIIGILLAISVPILKPMLESRRTSNAAQVLAGTFKHARMKAIQEGKNYGIRLSPYKTAPTAAVQLWLVKETFEGVVNDPLIRVVVENGKIIPYRFENGVWNRNVSYAEIAQHFKPGAMVQFNRLGRFFMVGGNFTLRAPYDNLNLPDDPANGYGIPMDYRISVPTSSASWLPPAVMPRGMIVDLLFSGGGEDDDMIPARFSLGDEVVVMFSPTGYVDVIFINGVSKPVNEMLYFCVGDWDRQIDVESNKTFAADGKSNLEAPATYWVTLHPKTGGIRVTENAPIKSSDPVEQLKDARRFAREHFFNVGER